MATLQGINIAMQAVTNLENLRRDMIGNAGAYKDAANEQRDPLDVLVATVREDAALYADRSQWRATKLGSSARADCDDALTTALQISLPEVSGAETELLSAANTLKVASMPTYAAVVTAANNLLAHVTPHTSLF